MKNYVRNAGWIFAEKLIRTFITFITFALISKQLGPESAGLLALSQSIAAMLLCITGLGLDAILIKEFSKAENNKRNDNVVFATVMILKFGSTLIISIVAVAFVILYNISTLDKVVYLIAISGLFFQTQTTYFSYYQAKSKSRIVTKLSFIGLSISTIVKILFIFYHVGIIWFAFSYILDIALSCIIIGFQARREGLKIDIELFSWEISKALLKQSLPIILSSLLVVLYSRVDQLIIAKMLTAKDLGVYSVAIRISEAYLFIPLAVSASFFPLLAGDNKKRTLKLYCDLVYFSSLISGVSVLIICHYFFDFLFGSEFKDTLSILSVTIFASIFSVMGAACTNYLVTINLTYMRLYRAILGLLVNLILLYFWIPQYGLIGAAWASFVGQFFAACLGNLMNKKTWLCFNSQMFSIITFGIPGVIYIFKVMTGKNNGKAN